MNATFGALHTGRESRGESLPSSNLGLFSLENVSETNGTN